MKNYQYIEELLERYFEARTSKEEEALLRTFFKQTLLPEHLRHYAPLFVYENEAAHSATLDESFDLRILRRLEEQGVLPQRRVRAQRMTLSKRIMPLWRSAAAVAIFALLGIATQEAVRKTAPSVQQEAWQELQIKLQQDRDLQRHTPLPRTQQMAIGGDSLHQLTPEKN